MSAAVRYVADLNHVREVSLHGTADLAFWKDRLAPEGLSPAEHDGRADRMPRRHDRKQDALNMEVPANAVVERPEDDPGRDGQRHEADGQQEQHRHEDQLGRDGRSGADLEVESERRCVRRDEEGNRERARRAVRVEDNRSRHRGHGKTAHEEHERDALSNRHPLKAPGPRLLDHALLFGIEQKGARCRHRSRHRSQIGSSGPPLDARGSFVHSSEGSSTRSGHPEG